MPIFREARVGLVVRLNKKQYDRRRFIDHGIKHVDLYFSDGSCPSREIVAKFLHIAEAEPGAIGVHCKVVIAWGSELSERYRPAAGGDPQEAGAKKQVGFF